ncbi:MAG: hypothetical protein R3B48_27355 [Kofleriaceae bacterium]
MRLVFLVLALLLAARSAAADARGDTDAALVELRAAEAAVRSATSSKQALGARYEGELRAIDRLKKQRGSWRRDRQLRESLAASLETAKHLETANVALLKATARHKAAQQRSLVAIREELETASEASRITSLIAQRDRLAPPQRASKKIILPNLELDPLADPEELDQQAAEIRQSEAAVSAEIASLEERSSRLLRVAELRRQHTRAEAMSDREDGQNRRGTFRSDGRPSPAEAGAGDASGNPGGGPSGGGDDYRQGNTFGEIATLAESSMVLGDVIDAATLETLRKAQASSDPTVRAAAAKRAAAAAAAKLEALRQQRALIEARARGLRKPAK